jgi:hypothetical protein
MKLITLLLESGQRIQEPFEKWKARLPKHTVGIGHERSPDGFGQVSIAFAKRQFQGNNGERYIVGKYFHQQNTGVIL